MKVPFGMLFSAAALAGGTLVAQQAEDPATADAPQSAEVADDESPATAKPLPRLLFTPDDVLETKTTDLGDRRVTMMKVVPVELPPPPEPAPPPDPNDPAIQARMQAVRDNSPATRFLMIGATTYRSSAFTDRGTRTRITLQGQENSGPVVCWSSADWDLLEGTGDFVDDEGRKHVLLVLNRSVDIDAWSAFVASRGGTYQPPVIPSIPAGAAAFVVTEGEPAPETAESLAALHDFYNQEKDELEVRRQARETERAARAAELLANPPQPKDIVIRHWRMDAEGQEGVTPQPAVAR